MVSCYHCFNIVIARNHFYLIRKYKKEGQRLRTKIEVKEFAKIDSASVYLDEFLLFVGDNNSGKTLLMELLYGVVDLIKKWKAECTNVKRTEREDIKYIRFGQEWYKDVENILAHRVLIDMIGIEEDEKQLFVPAARAGLQMLYRYMFAETTSANAGLPVPVSEYLNFIQTYTKKADLDLEESNLIRFVEEQLLNGKVEYENGQFVFKENGNIIPLNYASSMIHELSILSNILMSNQKTGYVYYDEVENSVHPLLQGTVARALIRFCNLGKK